ncbi:V-type ATP synthase subunit C [Methanolobus sp. ZRKC3]|uniref:V-type ATP synthase subunit C n=1 Tax=Methanolobus sp. ZRKC3 TaxID=3125786 RepID=UPI003245B38A
MQLLQKLKRDFSGSRKKGSSNYAYTATRVRAMKTHLFPKETYPRLMNMDINEMTRFIEESKYKDAIDEMARSFEGVDLIEHALNRNLAVSFTKLINISEGELNVLITEHLKEYDIWNIKTILRGKYCNASAEEIIEAIVAAGSLHYVFLSGLAAKDTYEEVVSELEDSEYYPILSQYNGENLSDIENQLDKKYYADMFNVIGYSKSKDRKLFANFIRIGIDTKNLMTLFRLKKSGMTDPELMDLMIDGGLRMDLSDIERMLALSFEEFIAELEKYPYWDDIADVVSPEMDSLIGVESRLKKHRLESATSSSHFYPLSIVPIMDYMLSKKNEVNNLRIIIRGKAANLGDDLIREQLVI